MLRGLNNGEIADAGAWLAHQSEGIYH